MNKDEVGQLTVLSGITASGKTTLAHEFVSRYPRHELIVTYTTRPLRSGEKTGVDYHQVTHDELDHMYVTGQLAERSELINGHRYATLKRDIEEVFSGHSKVWVVDLGRAINLQEVYRVFVPEMAQLLEHLSTLILVQPPSIEVAKERYLKRDKARDAEHLAEQEKKLAERLSRELAILENFSDIFSYVILNEEDHLEQALNILATMVGETELRQY